MFLYPRENPQKTIWSYHRGKWSRVRCIHRRVYFRQPHNADWSAQEGHRGQYQRWCRLGPVRVSTRYAGVLVVAYSYTGSVKREDIPEFLVRINSLCGDEVVYAPDLPDLLGVLSLLSPLVSNGIFGDAYE